ncbi:MAG: hypothetical protein ACI35V_06940 [Sphingobacterium composti]|uniref:hypothetical protein n=1 Tax=Sphingobacterium composti TaxID=363260 RepID=UPI00135C3ACC|nr:hypothetical protein [Sphingobacterium composti Ten et al. 2007 non Yoo et al. 2007]
MRILFILIALAFSSSCKESKENTTEILCHQEMKTRFEKELKCTEKDIMEVNLYSGLYNGENVYFTMTMCPACNTTPPQYGYSCDGTKISISNFNTKVSEIKEIYNSCTKRFSE